MYDPATALHGLEKVREAHPDNPALGALSSLATNARFDRSELTLTVARETIIPACQAIQQAGYNFLEDVTAVDWYPSEPRMQITYHVLSHSMKSRVRLVVFLNGDDLAIESIIPVWPSANFYEREVFDLFGVHFGGHPKLTRIMMPLDWEGHPLRKDYPVEGYR